MGKKLHISKSLILSLGLKINNKLKFYSNKKKMFEGATLSYLNNII